MLIALGGCYVLELRSTRNTLWSAHDYRIPDIAAGAATHEGLLPDGEDMPEQAPPTVFVTCSCGEDAQRAQRYPGYLVHVRGLL